MNELLSENAFTHNFYTIKTTDGLELFAQIWKPKENILGVINLVHGFGEHSSRYDNWAKRFTNEQFAVVSCDLRGHGKSQGKQGHIPSFEQLLKDIDCLVDFSEKELPKLPTFIYGHSMGGNIVLNYITRRNKDIKAAIVTSPWLKLTYPPSKFEIIMAGLLAKIFPKFTKSSNLKSDYISSSKSEVEKYSTDPLIHDKISVKLFSEITKAGKWILKHATECKTSLLLMHGTGDKITSHKASIEFARKNEKAKLKLWEGLYHEIHNEDACCEVFDYQSEWLKKQVMD